ncbi:DPP IV N-terminal domain-containing protein [Paraflavitalea speifideaquila]|uniref:DPP IV N-terminal domain-containing protein n=1 Tax=Paraflavitalea speifideaquila TaxID=3076558 RepID=UPI0028E42603|nr:DPP IV N-terminal domain-containing protein [Paraflavitalea speifideiaquila]
MQPYFLFLYQTACPAAAYSCQSPPARFRFNSAFPNGNTAPNQQWEAYIDQGNLFVKPTKGGEPIQFTTDGKPDKPYGGVYWSPDSKYLTGYHINTVKDSSVFYILTAQPGTMRGQLRSQPYKQPGDPWTIYTPFIFQLDQKKAVKVNAGPIDFYQRPNPIGARAIPATIPMKKWTAATSVSAYC